MDTILWKVLRPEYVMSRAEGAVLEVALGKTVIAVEV